MAVDAVEAERLRAEAAATERVLVVPVRNRVVVPAGAPDVVVAVPRLDCGEFRSLLCDLLQERPSPRLEARVWAASGGLAGRVCRTVRRLLRNRELTWSPDGLDVAARELLRPGSTAPARVRALLLPVLVQLSSWASSLEVGIAHASGL